MLGLGCFFRTQVVFDGATQPQGHLNAGVLCFVEGREGFLPALPSDVDLRQQQTRLAIVGGHAQQHLQPLARETKMPFGRVAQRFVVQLGNGIEPRHLCGFP